VKNKERCRLAKRESINNLLLFLIPHSSFLILLCVILLFSCDRSDASRRHRSSPVIEIEQSDKEIERIADNARRALPIFFRNLTRPEEGANNFYVKYPLTADDGGGEPQVREQVWLGNIRFKDGVYYGSITNTAKHTGSKKRDITFDPDSITDWMYIQDGKIIGGRSIKYLLEKIPETQRSEEQRRILRMFE
jgi:uncharacterized protein YegJ (DUF2314 family)